MVRERAPSPIPFRDASAQFLPWVIAVMVYLATLALAGFLLLNGAVAHWKLGVSDRLTVEIPAGTSAESVDAILESVRSTTGVAAATLLSKAEVTGLLEPWLGRDGIGSLPVPFLIDVRMDMDQPVDVTALAQAVKKLVPAVRVDDHKPWLDRLVVLGRSLQWLAAAVVVLIAIATIALVGFATRAGLAVHRDVIEVLHLIGARDSYVARQFQTHTLWLSLLGAVPGVLLAALTLYALSMLIIRLEAPMIPSLGLGAAEAIAFITLPVVAVLMATLAAWLTVMRLLRRML